MTTKRIAVALFVLFAGTLLSPPATADKYPSAYPTLAAIPCSSEIACTNIAHVQISAVTVSGATGMVSYDWHAVGDGLCVGSYYRPSGSATGCFVPLNPSSSTAFVGTRSVSAATTLTVGDGIVRVTNSGVDTIITAAPTAGSATAIKRVRVEKVSVDAYSVIITTDGATEVGRVINTNDAGGAGYLDVEMDGTTTRVIGVP